MDLIPVTDSYLPHPWLSSCHPEHQQTLLGRCSTRRPPRHSRRLPAWPPAVFQIRYTPESCCTAPCQSGYKHRNGREIIIYGITCKHNVHDSEKTRTCHTMCNTVLWQGYPKFVLARNICKLQHCTCSMQTEQCPHSPPKRRIPLGVLLLPGQPCPTRNQTYTCSSKHVT